jgi:3-oxoacyl-[acyl-carrier-protein] synthase-3
MGSARTIGLVGADCLSTLMEYNTNGRGTAILFGDGAGAVVVRATDDASKGVLGGAMHAEGSGWKEIYVPRCEQDFPPGVQPDRAKLNYVQMNGQGVFKFAVGTFPELIQQTLDKAGLQAGDIAQYVCHQSNGRILEAARKRFDIPPERMHVNIGRYGNTVGASVPLVFDELMQGGKVREGDRVMFLGFGAGLTWGSSLWQM